MRASEVCPRARRTERARFGEFGTVRTPLRRRLASLGEFFGTLLAMFKPRREEVRSQRMCPYCGLITPRAKRVCLECGKSLSAVSLERAEEKQG